MSETKRKNKDGQDKSHKDQATHRGRPDEDANVPKGEVHDEKKGPDSFENDLKRTS